MCTLTKKISDETIVGYKVAIKVDGRYYSPATGMEYKVGPITPMLSFGDIKFGFFDEFLLSPGSRCYSANLVGRTAVFCNLDGCKVLKRDMRIFGIESFDTCIVKMVLSDDIMQGNYAGEVVFAGKYIEFIEEVVNQ